MNSIALQTHSRALYLIIFHFVYYGVFHVPFNYRHNHFFCSSTRKNTPALFFSYLYHIVRCFLSKRDRETNHSLTHWLTHSHYYLCHEAFIMNIQDKINWIFLIGVHNLKWPFEDQSKKNDRHWINLPLNWCLCQCEEHMDGISDII